MNNHFCQAKHITDLLACEQCGNNQICCKQCFPAKHRGEKGLVHKSCKLVDSDVYKNFLRIAHVEWLVGQKVLKSLGGFELGNPDAKVYLANTAFYGSQFYKDLFGEEESSQQYLILKCYFTGNPQSFKTLSSLQKLLNGVKSQDLISKYIVKLTQPSEEEKVMNSHIDFYTGADIYYLGQFFAEEQELFVAYVKSVFNEGQPFSVYKYIEHREKLQHPRNSTYYSNEFTAFMVEYYRRDMEEFSYFTLNDYMLNYWQFFNTAVQVNPTLKQFIDSEIEFYQQYERIMQENNLNITYLGFKIWKLSNGVSKELPYLKNHYFLFAFVEGYLNMKIQKTYSFATQEEKDLQSKENWLDFAKYIKDYSLFLQQKNKLLAEQQQQHSLKFETYTTYCAYRKRMQPLHDKIKGSKDNIYDKEVAVKFFNHHFESGTQLKPKLYKDFFEKCEEQKVKEEEKFIKETQQLKAELQQQEKEDFYEFIYLNYINYSKESVLKITKDRYLNFKQQSMQTMDLDYIKLTQEKFKRGDFNAPVEWAEVEEKGEQPQVIIGETGAKITIGIDKFEEGIFEDKINDDEGEDLEPECGCCGGDAYNCKAPDCQMMGYCTACSDDY